jgi:hypothetical protein
LLGLTTFYALAALGLFWIVVRNGAFRAGIYGVLIFTTFWGTMVTFAGMTAAVLFASAFVAVEFIRLARGRGTLTSPSLLDLLACCFVIWTLLATTIHSVPIASFVRQPLIILLILAAAKAKTSNDEEVTNAILDGLLVGGIFVTVSIWVQFFVSPSLFGTVELIRSEDFLQANFDFRPSSFHGNPNSAALYLLLALGGVLTTLSSRRLSLASWIPIGIALALLHALFLLQSRSAMIGAILMILFWVFSNSTILGRVVLSLNLGLVALLALLNPGRIEQKWELLFPTRGGFEDGIGREDRWEIAGTIIQSSPLIGEPGLLFMGKWINYHNDFLGVAAYFGLPALLFFALLIGVCAYAAFHRSKLSHADTRLARLVLLLLLGVLFHAQFHQVLLGGICFWFVLGTVYNQHLRHVRALSTRPSHPSRAPPC